MSIVQQSILDIPPILALDANGAAETQGQVYKLSVPATASEPLTVTAPDGSYFSWQPTELLYRDENGVEDYIVESMPSQLSILGRQARYLRTFANADDVFHAEADRVKHWTVLNEPPRAAAEFLSGKIEFGISGIISGVELPQGISNSINVGLFQLPQPIITDLTGQQITGYYEVVGQQLYIWFDAEFLQDAVYPVMVDPTVVVASSYIPSPYAKPQILSNGWIVVSCLHTSTVYFYVSKDSGATWSQLCTYNPNGGTVYYCVCSYGTIIYCEFANNSGSSYFTKFDATTVTNTGQSPISYPLNGQTSIWGCSMAVSSTGAITLALSVINPNYSSSRNLVSVRSLDGGTTWTTQSGSAGFDQITTFNISGVTVSNPYVIYNNGVPYILTVLYSSGYNIAVYTTKYTTHWNTYCDINWGNNYVSNGVIAAYNTECPVVLVKKYGANIGRLWCLWDGEDSTDTSYNNIRASYSDDNGVTWSGQSTMLKVTSGNTSHRQYPTICEKPNGDIIVVYNDGTTVSYQVCANGGTTFAGLTSLGNGSNPSISDATNNISEYIWQTSSNVSADKFSFNTAPLAPTGLTCPNFDATVNQTFTWTFNDPDVGDAQSAYEVMIIRVSDGATMKDTGKVASTVSSYTLPLNTLTNGVQYQWKVTTWDNSSAQSPYSGLATFTTSGAPTVTVTMPVNNGDSYSFTNLTTIWSMSDPSSTGQSAYQVRLTDNSDNVLFTTGKLSDANARSYTIPYSLTNSSYYKVKITCWNGLGVQSTEVVRTFYESFTAPATPILTHADDNIRGAITLNIANPTPTGSQPTVLYNDIYRMASTETVFTRIATNISNNGTYTDYTTACGVSYQYKINAIGSNTTIAYSNMIITTITFKNAQLALVSNYTQYVNLKFNPSRQDKTQYERALMQFAGRADPVAEFGEHCTDDLTMTFTVLALSDLQTLQSLISSKQMLFYKDYRGRRMFCTVADLSINDEKPNIYTVSFTPNKTSYMEAV